MIRKISKSLLAAILFLPLCAMADPPIWDTDFGADTGLMDDDDSIVMTLGFMFPFDGTDYDSVSIVTNGAISLGVAGVFAGDEYITYDLWEDGEFEDYFSNIGGPVLAPFNADLDNETVGTIHFKSDATTAVITWNAVASYENDSAPFITFQATLASDGTITYGYNGITGDMTIDQNEGIVVGVTNGLGDVPPASSDLSGSVSSDLAAATSYEIWCYDEDMLAWGTGSCYTPDPLNDPTRPDNYAFDLDQTNVVFTPNATGGYDLSTAAAPPPPPAPPPPAFVPDAPYSAGCTVGPSDGTTDPTLPLLILISLMFLTMRRKHKV